MGSRAGQAARAYGLPARPCPHPAQRGTAQTRRQDTGRHPPAPSTRCGTPAPRTRLTHSLECAQVGRELGAALGCDPDLVEAACLAHDLGHPPFGHNGEAALNEFAHDCGGFEGNAQSLRLLTRIEPKRFTPEGSVGLNLTRATLDAATKYPWPRGGHPTDPASRKFGVYEDDRPVFDWVRRTAPGTRACFEAQVMDWSDDVAYSVHDVEDGLHAGHIDPNMLHAEPERREIFAVAVGRYVPEGTDPAELAAALDRLQDQEWWPHGYDGSAVAQARLKDATSQLIGRFCLAAEGATRAAYGSGRLTRYGAELVVPWETRLECAVLKAVADRYVMQRAEQERVRADQRIVVAELAEALTARAPDGLDPQFRTLFEQAADDRARKRVVVDQIASLTDTSARSLHARLTGQGRN
ncbi:deoxyguanosinetriphosphate triphosphohydrolase [Streptomyces thermocoprophilus]